MRHALLAAAFVLISTTLLVGLIVWTGNDPPARESVSQSIQTDVSSHHGPLRQRTRAGKGHVSSNAAPIEPVTYFQASCARCHGPYGQWYDTSLGQWRTEPELRQLIVEMAAGQAQAPLDEPGVIAQAALHHAIMDGLPYANITQRQPNLTSGEFLPGTTLTATRHGQSIDVHITGHRWLVNAPADGLVLTLSRNGKTADLSAEQ